jgi:hypothetical protein
MTSDFLLDPAEEGMRHVRLTCPMDPVEKKHWIIVGLLIGGDRGLVARD